MALRCRAQSSKLKAQNAERKNAEKCKEYLHSDPADGDKDKGEDEDESISEVPVLVVVMVMVMVIVLVMAAVLFEVEV